MRQLVRRKFALLFPIFSSFCSRSLDPTGMTRRPPTASCCFKAGGTSGPPAATRMASNGAASGQPKVPRERSVEGTGLAGHSSRGFPLLTGLSAQRCVGATTCRPLYFDRILRGANPAELPVQVPTKFEMR